MSKNIIFILDLDGTLISSEKVIIERQVQGVIRYLYETGQFSFKNNLSKDKKLFKEIKQVTKKDLEESNLVPLLTRYKLTPAVFFKNYYRTFNIDLAIENQQLIVYPDAKCFLDQNKDFMKFIITNSNQEFTLKKLNKLKIVSNFDIVLAESESYAKPNIYMGEIVLNHLIKNNILGTNPLIYVIGDHDIDILFGENLKNKYKSIKTVFISRGINKIKKSKPDIIVKNLFEFTTKYLENEKV